MIAHYEQKKLSGENHVSAAVYKNLVNLPHWHTEHELIYALRGNAELMVENESFFLDVNRAAFVSEGEVHYIKSSADSVITVMKLSPDFVADIVGDERLKSPMVENCYPFNDCLREILRELSGEREYGGIIAECAAKKLLAEIFRTEITVPNESKPAASQSFKALLRFVSQNFSSVTFDEAADFMGFSRPYFSKYFRRLSGMTFTRYVNTVRISAAAEAISANSCSITEIALQCGFGTIRSFNRVFREYTGFCPSELPENYVFAAHYDGGAADFDPTLACTEECALSEIG